MRILVETDRDDQLTAFVDIAEFRIRPASGLDQRHPIAELKDTIILLLS